MSKGRLLLADDSLTIQKVVNLTFADEGIDVTTVGDGDAAIEKIGEIRPDIVLADVHMPGLSGYEVCEQIRSDPQTREIPVILLVGSFEPFDESEAARVGANAYLTKPFQSIRQLVAQVSELIESSAANSAAPEPAPEPVDEGEPVYSHASTATTVPLTPLADGSPRTADIDNLELASYQGGSESDEGTEARDIESLYEESLSDVGADDDMIETSFASTETTAPPPAAEFADAAEHRTEEMHFDPNELPDESHGEAARAAAGYSFEHSPAPQALPDAHEEPVHGELDHTIYSTSGESRPVAFDSQTAAGDPFAAPAMPNVPAYEERPRTFGEDTIPMVSRFDHTSSAPFRFDDLDLLDLSAPKDQNVEITSPADAIEKGANQQLVTLSPELIEMIAQRVVEKLSEKY